MSRWISTSCDGLAWQRKQQQMEEATSPTAELVSFAGREMDNVMRVSANTTIVVLGASGDLAKKKTFPALFGLFKNNFLPENTQIVGYARSKLSNEEFHDRITSHIKNLKSEDKSKVSEFLKKCIYVAGQYDKDEDWKMLNSKIEELEQRSSVVHRVFYMALPPTVYISSATGLKKCCYSTKGSNRLVIEKPFGHDLESSQELGEAIGKLWSEEEIYRIDHYLGKDMVKNIMILRFANIFFGATWNRDYISNIQITFKEAIGTEGRGGYFDEFGIIRDVMQNHLMQVLSVLTMEKPMSLDAEDTRDEKVKVLRSIPPIELKDVLLGQYGKSEDGSKPGYKDDEGVPKDSRTPTFAACVLFCNNERWEGVPIIMKAGKALNESKVEIRVQFKDVPGNIFNPRPVRNELVIRIQPDEAVYQKIMNKLPGLSMIPVVSELDLTYKARYSNNKIPDAYEALILDVMRGDHANFVRDDELDAAWKIFTPLLHKLEREKIQPKPYKFGTRGPDELNDFVARYGYTRGSQEYKWSPPNRL